MAKGNPANLRPPYQKGQSGNPSGRAKTPPDILEARKLNQHELERILNRYLWMTSEDLKAHTKDPKTPMMEVMVASIVSLASLKGDQQRLDFILNRLVGKVQDKIELSSAKPYVVERLDGTKLELGIKTEEET